MKSDDENAAADAIASKDLLARARSLAYSNQHEESWRNGVANSLNEILGRVVWTLETAGEPQKCDVDFARSCLEIVERVSDFEEIKRANAPHEPRRE
jgi:hypothetical protein